MCLRVEWSGRQERWIQPRGQALWLLMPVARSHGWPLEMEASPGLQVDTGGKLAGQGGPRLDVVQRAYLYFKIMYLVP